MMIVKDQKGMTLVEIIVAIAIIGIIAVAFLPVFAGMFKGITIGGHRGKATFEAQQAIEDQMADSSIGTWDTIEIKHEDGTPFATVNGRILEVTEPVGSTNEDVKVKVFVPTY